MSGDCKSKYNVVFVLGGPGAGKGTQCEWIQEEFGYVHLSAGELLRQERLQPNSEFGAEIEKHLKEGTIVPVKVTCALLRRHDILGKLEADCDVESGHTIEVTAGIHGILAGATEIVHCCKILSQEMEQSEKDSFLIDGFPRNRDNLDGWNAVMSGVAEVRRVLFFDCPDQVCIDRCLNRGLTSGRTDDNAESLQKRIQTYRESTLPVIQHYAALNLVSKINGDRQTSEVFEDVKKVFDSLKCSPQCSH